LFFILFSDPPRDGVDRCIKQLRRNGINVVIVTGDSLETTRSVCEKVGFTEEEGNEERLHDPKTSSLDIIISNKVVLSGKDLDNLTEDEKVNLVSKASIVYRAEPRHKLEVVKALKRANKQVLMVGDGVNDVLAMNYCDISVSMGCGNDLCKDRCDLIITDDDFLKIIRGIEGGKESIHNMLCLLKYLISSNLGEVFCILLCYILNVKECLGSSHLLLVNVLTDGLPATFLCMSSGGCRARKSGLSRGLAIRTISIGLYSGLTTFLVYFHYLSYSTRGPRLEYKDIRNVNPHDQLTGTTLSLIFIICAEMMNSLNNISLHKSLLRVNIWKDNRYLTMSAISSIALLFVISKYDVMRTIFNVGEVRPDEFFFLLILSFPVILIDEAFKIFLKD
jgi:Ca2+ transporting ATPase